MNIEELIKSANSGDADAAYELSQHFFQESGEDVDDQRYQLWLATAAQRGNAKAVKELNDLADEFNEFDEMNVTFANYLFDYYVSKGDWPDCFTERIENRANSTRDGKLAYTIAEHYDDPCCEEKAIWLAKAFLWGHRHGYLSADLFNYELLQNNYEFCDLLHDEFMRHNRNAEKMVDYWEDDDEVKEWHEERGDKLPEEDDDEDEEDEEIEDKLPKKDVKPKRKAKGKKSKKKQLSFFDKVGITLKKIFKS